RSHELEPLQPPAPPAEWREGDRADHVLPVRRSLVLELAGVPARRPAHLGAVGTAVAAAGEPPRAAAAGAGLGRSPPGTARAVGLGAPAAADFAVAGVERGGCRAVDHVQASGLVGAGQPVRRAAPRRAG